MNTSFHRLNDESTVKFIVFDKYIKIKFHSKGFVLGSKFGIVMTAKIIIFDGDVLRQTFGI